MRYLNEDEKVVEKCTMCEQKIAQGELPQCVAQCGGRARYFGDLEQGIDSFVGPAPVNVSQGDKSYTGTVNSRATLGESVTAYSDSDVYALPDVGNKPSCLYILRDRTWQG